LVLAVVGAANDLAIAGLAQDTAKDAAQTNNTSREQQTSEVLTGQEEPDDPPPLLGAGAALTLRMAVAMMMRVWVVNCILMFGVGKELDLVESAVD